MIIKKQEYKVYSKCSKCSNPCKVYNSPNLIKFKCYEKHGAIFINLSANLGEDNQGELLSKPRRVA